MRQKCQTDPLPKGIKDKSKISLSPLSKNPRNMVQTQQPALLALSVAHQWLWSGGSQGLRLWMWECWVSEVQENEWLWLGRINWFVTKSHFPSTRSHIQFCCSNFQQMSSIKPTASFSANPQNKLLTQKESELSVQKEAFLILQRKY